MSAIPETTLNGHATPRCDLCGGQGVLHILRTQRLDGPLLRCAACQLYFVPRPIPASHNGFHPPDQSAHLNGHRPHSEIAAARVMESGHAAEEMQRLSTLARELRLVQPEVEEQESPWRVLTARERINDLRRFRQAGRLLEIGSSTGDFLLEAAAAGFTATGVEADRDSSAVAQSRGAQCFNGTLPDAGFADHSLDVVVMYHVIEHLPSPRLALREIHRILRPGGLLVMETPNIDNIWFRLLGHRWRQFIPDHIYFFTPATMTRLCAQGEFEIRELRAAGKTMSLRLFLSRVGRYHRPLAGMLQKGSAALGLGDRTIRLNPGDVMRVYAERK
ncbi:MAG: class I SAM-dependent methyltransferase [Blastocatellia bacterium]